MHCTRHHLLLDTVPARISCEPRRNRAPLRKPYRGGTSASSVARCSQGSPDEGGAVLGNPSRAGGVPSIRRRIAGKWTRPEPSGGQHAGHGASAGPPRRRKTTTNVLVEAGGQNPAPCDALLGQAYCRQAARARSATVPDGSMEPPCASPAARLR